MVFKGKMGLMKESHYLTQKMLIYVKKMRNK